jgi:hypothetical protein
VQKPRRKSGFWMSDLTKKLKSYMMQRYKKACSSPAAENRFEYITQGTVVFFNTGSKTIDDQ